MTNYPIEQNSITQPEQYPFIWFQRQSLVKEVFITGESGASTAIFAVEVISDDLDEANSIADIVRLLHAEVRQWSQEFCLLCEVDDVEDTYSPKNVASEGIHIVGLTITVIHK